MGENRPYLGSPILYLPRGVLRVIALSFLFLLAGLHLLFFLHVFIFFTLLNSQYYYTHLFNIIVLLSSRYFNGITQFNIAELDFVFYN